MAYISHQNGVFVFQFGVIRRFRRVREGRSMRAYIYLQMYVVQPKGRRSVGKVQPVAPRYSHGSASGSASAEGGAS